MARIFLSYDRDDADRARPIALALEKAGHSVWWDPHIKAGEQYTKVIDEALQAADAVVVLWSAHSIESTWVRDEAAVGRDKGRLVPILIDAISPPLGFRQFQNIDMSRWRGRGRTRQWHEVADALETLTGEKSPQRIESVRRFRISLSRIVAGLTVALALMVGRIFPAARTAGCVGPDGGRGCRCAGGRTARPGLAGQAHHPSVGKLRLDAADRRGTEREPQGRSGLPGFHGRQR